MYMYVYHSIYFSDNKIANKALLAIFPEKRKISLDPIDTISRCWLPILFHFLFSFFSGFSSPKFSSVLFACNVEKKIDFFVCVLLCSTFLYENIITFLPSFRFRMVALMVFFFCGVKTT